ncbi:protein FAM3C [Myxocyprinus asiaticus]|uniref:protein FAM3C n=1 Tax=Myxocyprinus asiaticus TaxID=70543 RepID=UPI002223CFDE|nr:protein FAM3C [Myxocyprinus asiaticus]
MRLQGLFYVLTTTVIIVLWRFSINWSNLQEAAKRSFSLKVGLCDIANDIHGPLTEDLETDCANTGLFKSHSACCPHKDCPVDYFPFQLRSGAANVMPPKICFNNTTIMGGIRNNAGQGLNIVLINGETGEVLRSNYFNMETGEAEELLGYLKTIKPGNIILVASYVDPATKLTDEIRDIFSVLGSTMVRSVRPRDSWVFAGAYRIKEASPFEKLIQNDMKTNAYGDWPEMVEIIGCFPRMYN